MIVTISCVGRNAQKPRRVSKAETPRSLPPPSGLKAADLQKTQVRATTASAFCFLLSAFCLLK
jgi:hypothetical protein